MAYVPAALCNVSALRRPPCCTQAEHRELLRRFALVHPPVKVMAYVKVS